MSQTTNNAVSSEPPSAILLIHCPDRQGIVAAVTDFIATHHGNILHLEQHVDAEHQVFFMRVMWDLRGFALANDEIGAVFRQRIAERFAMQWLLSFSSERLRMAVFVSRLPHCLYDILARYQTEWAVEIPLIVSNHTELEPIARRFDIPYHVFEITRENKQAQEQRQLTLLHEQRIDLVVLARYMQIISDSFVAHYPNRIINIHHSFLPAFPGARPYHSAHERGVKIIGATSHYVTADLDAGPIIEQDVVRVSHRNTVADMIRLGRDLEKVVLSRAVWYHLQRKILVYGNRTVIFG